MGKVTAMKHFILVVTCPDQTGIVAAITSCLSQLDINISHMDQHSTKSPDEMFFCRCECIIPTDSLSVLQLESHITEVAKRLNAQWHIHNMDTRLKVGILVSKPTHCLLELLHQWESGDLNIQIPFIISNHSDHYAIADHYDIPYHIIPATSTDRKEQDILQIAAASDCLVLARYMQILSPQFLATYSPKPIINIHHSFLPSFKGANPYKQAYDRGVKIIGASAHYVTEELDEGPIIHQVVQSVTHRDDPISMKTKGKQLEKLGLAEALRLHVECRVLMWNNRTIIFP